MRDFVRRHRLPAFWAMAIALSWAYWIPVAMTGGEMSHFPGLMGPLVAGFVVTAMADGRNGSWDLARRMVRWRVPGRWYAAALVPGAVGAVAVAGQALVGEWPAWRELSSMPGLPEVGWVGTFGMVLVVNGFGEEVGWRGVAWPELRRRRSIGRAAMLLAVPWAIWHVPVFWIDSGLRGFDLWLVPGWLGGLAAGAVVLGWLVERADGSLLVVAIFHAFLNMASATPATEGIPAIAASVVVIGWAVWILRRTVERDVSEIPASG
ncbi:MAG TPA: CPBP family intramembrane glutamic endopeptidase [Acidimicrobiia bacterium]|nr:CPBP family intramembrane glutamic endopeptidase [Acidimicrobiia bacterium]